MCLCVLRLGVCVRLRGGNTVCDSRDEFAVLQPGPAVRALRALPTVTQPLESLRAGPQQSGTLLKSRLGTLEPPCTHL